MSNAFEIAATLTQRQQQALVILAKAERPLRNRDFHERFETDGRRTTGWAKALGPCTKPRKHDDKSLWARYLVDVVDNCSYIITDDGREVARVIDARGIRPKTGPMPAHTDGPSAIRPVTRLDTGKQASTLTPPVEDVREVLSLPTRQLVGKLDLDTLSQRACEAVACSYCFTSDRAREWGRVARRPADRPDDVAFAPWIGHEYSTATPRVVVMLMNPGHKPAHHKLKRRDLGKRLRDGEITYEEYIAGLTPLVREWGDGDVVPWLQEMGLNAESIGFLNVALCAVADDKYFPKLFQTCFERHTRRLLATLEPDVVLLAGTKVARFRRLIEASGTKVVLTWHYRPRTQNTAELLRVREKLEKLRRRPVSL